MRSKDERKAAKKLLGRPPGPLKPLDLSQCSYVPAWMTRAWSNNRYTVTVDDNAQMTGGVTATRVMVQRHDDAAIPGHWREMQNIKNELFGRQTTAIEYYPAEDDLVDDHNIYWMWILPEGTLPLRMKR